MFTPSQNKAVSNRGTNGVSQKGINNPDVNNPQGYNTFDRSRKFGQCARFQDIKPFYCVPEIEGNVTRLMPRHNLNTFTLSGRVQNDIRMDKQLYNVPFSSISPNSWEVLYRMPKTDEDIVYQDVCQGVSLQRFSQFIYNFFTKAANSITTSSTLEQMYSRMLPVVITMANMSSSDSVLYNLGNSLPFATAIDTMYERFLNSLMSLRNFDRTIQGKSSGYTFSRMYFVDSNEVVHNVFLNTCTLSELRQFVEDYRFYLMYLATNPVSDISDGGLVSITINVESPEDAGELTTTINDFVSFVNDLTGDTSSTDVIFNFFEFTNNDWCEEAFEWDNRDDKYFPIQASDKYMDLRSLVAYQQICYQFFTNSIVDDVYTAKEFMTNMFSKERDGSPNQPFEYLADIYFNEFAGTDELSEYAYNFELDGVKYQYDAFSGYYMRVIFDHVINNVFVDPQMDDTLVGKILLNYAAYINMLFGYNRSLRYADYFVSGRPRPYAQGDVIVDVAGDGVTALDVNRSQWIQRLRQAVNRIPRNIYEYLRGLTGVMPEKTLPQPNYIATESYPLTSERIENTAEEQGNIVSLLHSSGGQRQYEYFIDEPSFTIGVLTFVSDNIYPEATDKFHYFGERTDWFNHFLQYVGEESVDALEMYKPKSLSLYNGSPISYQQRYSAFKYGINRVSGGFLGSQLSSWFIRRDYKKYMDTYIGQASVISSEFIRNNNIDFDPLYSSLTGASPRDYYHFIIKHTFSDIVNSRQQKFAGLDV